jgi:hypothetical protein
MTRRILGVAFGVALLAGCSSGLGSQFASGVNPTARQLEKISHRSAGCGATEQITLRRKGGTIFYPACSPFDSMPVSYLGYEYPSKGTVKATVENGVNNYDDVPEPTQGGKLIYFFSVCCLSKVVQWGTQQEPPNVTLSGPKSSHFKFFPDSPLLITYVSDGKNHLISEAAEATIMHCNKTRCKLSFESPFENLYAPQASRIDFAVDMNPTGS